MPSSDSRARIAALSWANRSASAPGMDGHPVGGQRGDVLVRDVLVVPGDDVAAGGEAAQVVERAVVADHDVVGDERGAVVGRVGQDPQRLAERDRGLMRHPGQLTGADHADDGQSGAGVHEQRA